MRVVRMEWVIRSQRRGNELEEETEQSGGGQESHQRPYPPPQSMGGGHRTPLPPSRVRLLPRHSLTPQRMSGEKGALVRWCSGG